LTAATDRETITSMPETANHEGELEQVVRAGLLNLSVSGWARDRDSAAPVQVEIVVNGAVRETVTADRPRPGEPSNGFSARIFTPSQPALVCARTVAPPPLDGLVVGCRRFRFPVAVSILHDADEPAPSGQVASFFWVDSRGDVAKTLGDAPVENGAAVYDGDPLLEEELSWAVTVHDPAERPFFRSGPLEELPGPPGGITAETRSIVVQRHTQGGNLGLRSGETAPHLVTERLEQLPAQILGVTLDVDGAGREVVTVAARREGFPFIGRAFTYTLAVTVRPDSDPGRPDDVLVVEPASPGTGTGRFRSLADELDRAIVDGVKQSLEAGARFLGAVQLQQIGSDLRATHVSVTSVELVPSSVEPSVVMVAHGGAITGGVGGVVP
jgi:hypothetical protein